VSEHDGHGPSPDGPDVGQMATLVRPVTIGQVYTGTEWVPLYVAFNDRVYRLVDPHHYN
jgi:hypothetical protein